MPAEQSGFLDFADWAAAAGALHEKWACFAGGLLPKMPRETIWE
jgi:hypothetical protein